MADLSTIDRLTVGDGATIADPGEMELEEPIDRRELAGERPRRLADGEW
jgi:hypothetical protein